MVSVVTMRGNIFVAVRVAFLGLGDIGWPMATHLAGRFDLVVWNRTAEKAERFAAEHRAIVAASPREAAAAAEIVVTCLPSSREVKQVLFEGQGLAAGVRSGSLLIDCTSGDPASSIEIAARLATKRVAFVDAPVSGGVAGAEKGALTVMCGGSAADVGRARAVLDAFAQKVEHCGGVGAGHAVKAANQALLAIHIWATGEVLAALAKAGVDPGIALEVINVSSGRSNASQNLIPQRVLSREFPRTFRLALLEKDVRIALELARRTKTPAPFVALAEDLFARALAELGDKADHVEAVRMIECDAGVELRSKPRGE